MILPYSSELRIGFRSHITYGIMLLCVVLFLAQESNRDEINLKLNLYCDSIHLPKAQSKRHDYFRWNKSDCVSVLALMHRQSNVNEWPEYSSAGLASDVSPSDREHEIVFELAHYQQLLMNYVPADLDGMLMYYPDTYNPFKMLTSALAHADWMHLIFNLIFFFAFAPAIEILIGSKWKFVTVLVVIELVTGILYSLASAGNAVPIPTLGLSGSVMGMIGLSAFMMPKARIRTFIWIIFSVLRVSIPAWILALWYIGWDAYDFFTDTNTGGINLIAHLAGGVTGYLLGLFWFKKQKERVQDELNNEIDYMRAQRQDSMGMMSSFSGDRQRIDGEQQAHQAKLTQGRYMDRLFKLVNSGAHGEAMMHILADYDLHSKSIEIYEELFEEIGNWKKKRVYLCMGRLLIMLYLKSNQYANAFIIIEACQSVDDAYVLHDAKYVVPLTEEAVNQQRYGLAHALVKDYVSRYHEQTQQLPCLLLEANILWLHFGKTKAAKLLLEAGMRDAGVVDAEQIRIFMERIDSTCRF